MPHPVIFQDDYKLGIQVKVLLTCKGWRQIDSSSIASVTQSELPALERDLYVSPSNRREIVAALGFVSMTPAERKICILIGAYSLHAQGGTNTGAARAVLMSRFDW